ncbi:hypothetical protein EBH_0035110 [Eimeria brunetti]|uniref:Uncharacterized protein n=1 Tax=Eimeria brunetti TaxID=51314 RepID=U6LS16_9EIME|nr:hypothetical protein EBH_0035110 [Eimeria brunetti]
MVVPFLALTSFDRVILVRVQHLCKEHREVGNTDSLRAVEANARVWSIDAEGQYTVAEFAADFFTTLYCRREVSFTGERAVDVGSIPDSGGGKRALDVCVKLYPRIGSRWGGGFAGYRDRNRGYREEGEDCAVAGARGDSRAETGGQDPFMRISAIAHYSDAFGCNRVLFSVQA